MFVNVKYEGLTEIKTFFLLFLQIPGMQEKKNKYVLVQAEN